MDARIEYWRPEPQRRGFAWWALLLPAVVYSAGVIVYAHAAFVPGAVHENGHAIGSALMVFGGEAGTLMAASEVFRKSQTKDTNALDWIGLVVSLIATLGNLFVVYTALATLSMRWVNWARTYGPMVLLLCSGLDFYANVMEFGFYNASFDRRWESWNDDCHAWRARKDAQALLAGRIERATNGNQEAQVTRQEAAEAHPVTIEAHSVKPEAQLQETSRADAIRKAHKAHPEYTQVQLAQLAGCSRGYVSKVLGGK